MSICTLYISGHIGSLFCLQIKLKGNLKSKLLLVKWVKQISVTILFNKYKMWDESIYYLYVVLNIFTLHFIALLY